jgi:3-oxoacyl-[acyl-carrier protein] reductase
MPNPRAILITGASSGIGAACARRLAGPGVQLLLHARASHERLEAVAQEATTAGAEVVTALGDLTESGVGEELVEQAVAAFGRLDTLVANAGFPIPAPLEVTTNDDFERAFRGNALSFAAMARAARPLLAKSGAGRIVAIGSFTAHVFRTDLPQFPASVAAKGALETMVRALALTLAAEGTTVNCVVPGFIAKDRGVGGNIDPARLADIAARIPAGRLGTPADVAALVAFLAGPEAAYITGQSLHVNGGLC